MANIEEARGEAEAISIINSALSENPYYLEASRDNLGKLMLELREKNGPGAIAKLVESEIMRVKYVPLHPAIHSTPAGF